MFLKKIRPLALTSCALSLALISCQPSELASNGGKSYSSSTAVVTSYSPVSNYSISNSAGVEELVTKALSHHPALTAAKHKIQRLEAKIPQAESLPDPKARISAGSMAETAAGRVNTIIGVEQSIPFPGKRKTKASMALKEANAARAELQNKRLLIAERVRFAYWNYYLATQSSHINSNNKEVLESIREIVEAKVKANQGTQADLLRISTEINKVEQQLIRARQQRSSAKASLNALLNRRSNAHLPYPRKSSVPSLRNLNSLLAKAESSHPSIKAGQARINAFQQRLHLAKLDAYPDFMIGAQYANVSESGLSPVANGRDQAMITLGITIPLWDKPRKAKIREANAGIAEMSANVNSSRAILRQRIEDAWFRAKSSREMISLFDDKILPDAQQAHDLSLQSYSAGKQSFVDVLDTWRLLLKFQLQQENNRAELGKASAALKSAAAIQ